MKNFQASFQIGKSGLSEDFIDLLRNSFKTRENIKIHVLKSAGHAKENIEKIAQAIVRQLGKKYTYRIVGFTIFIKRWRKSRKFI